MWFPLGWLVLAKLKMPPPLSVALKRKGLAGSSTPAVQLIFVETDGQVTRWLAS